MASRKEEVILAVIALFEAALPQAKIVRNVDAPQTPAPHGTIVIRDGDQGEPIAVLLSPLTYTWTHAIGVEVVAPAGTAPETRSEALDAMLVALGEAIEADRTLGGLCDWLEPTTADADDINPASTQPARWAGFDVRATYDTYNPLA